MKTTTITVPIYVLEESDVSGFTERARVRGEAGQVRQAIIDQLPEGFSADVGITPKGRRGDITLARITGPGGRAVTLEVGEGVSISEILGYAFIPTHVVDEALLAEMESEADGGAELAACAAQVKELEIRNAELEREVEKLQEVQAAKTAAKKSTVKAVA